LRIRTLGDFAVSSPRRGAVVHLPNASGISVKMKSFLKENAREGLKSGLLAMINVDQFHILYTSI
jgi:hypothetical protein